MPRASTTHRKTHRAKPGARGTGKYFHIQVRPKSEFVAFRNQDVGGRGGEHRDGGRDRNGSLVDGHGSDSSKQAVDGIRPHDDLPVQRVRVYC